jgi:acyl carrier protein
MIPKAMDSFDLVEAVTLIEEVLGTEYPITMQRTSAVHERWWTGLNFTVAG